MTSSLPFGPGETFVIPEIEELCARGHVVTVVPVHPRGPVVHDDAAPLLDRTDSLPAVSPRILFAAVAVLARRPRRSAKALARLLRSRNAGILGKNLLVFPKGLWLARLVRRRGIDHIHAHWTATSATLAMVAADVARVPWSVTAHRWDLDEDNLLATKAAHACFIRAIDDRGLAKIERRARGRARSAFVLHVGVRLPDSVVRVAWPPRRLLVAASLREVKGHRDVLDAIALLQARGIDVVADLVGDGPLRDELTARIESLALRDAVRLCGARPHRRLLTELDEGRWDLVVLGSVVTARGEEEGVPVSLLEAMSRGIPVVATSTGSIPYLLAGGAGILVPPGDPGALADAIARLVSDRELSLSVGAAGRRRVEALFSIERVVETLEKRFLDCARVAA